MKVETIPSPNCFMFNPPLDKKTGMIMFAMKYQEYFSIVEDAWNNNIWDFKFGNCSIGLKCLKDIEKCRELVSKIGNNAGQTYERK